MNTEFGFVPIWRVHRPTEAATLPEWMSFHYLREAETCPRSFALKHATYGQLWNGSGFPAKPSIAIFVGLVVHAAAELVIRELMNNGVASPNEPRAMDTLRQLGGYSAIISRIIEERLRREAENPRFREVGAAFQQLLTSKIPRMRETLQELVREQSWTLRTQNGNAGFSKAPVPASNRRPLQFGTHFEIELRDPAIKWKGRVDIITISDSSCILIDLKTGTPSEEHEAQLRVYSVLWDGDRELNPRHLPISAMSLCYGGNSVGLSTPTGSELRDLRDELKRRTLQVKSELDQEHAIAKPSIENCRYCHVKLLCDDYWRTSIPFEWQGFRDIELRLESPRGDGEVAWMAQVILPTGKTAENVLIRRSSNEAPFWKSFRPDMIVRLTEVQYTARENDLALIGLTPFCEALLLEQ